MRDQRTWYIFALACLALILIATGCAQEAPKTSDVEAAPQAADVVPAADAGGGGACAGKPYTVNPDAAQDVIVSSTGFLRCEAGEYALCYYSGADPLPCTLEESGESASCQCQVFTASEAKPMYVLMTSILNLCAYTEAVEQCGEDGSGCYNICNDNPHSPQCKDVTLPADQQTATVCQYIEDGTFDPGADYISTFSLETVFAPGTINKFGLACNDDNGQYAGCMTASCSGTTQPKASQTASGVESKHAYTNCDCPVWPAGGASADYQFGRKCYDPKTGDPTPTENCQLLDGQLWSAAYNPLGCPQPPEKPEAGTEAGP